MNLRQTARMIAALGMMLLLVVSVACEWNTSTEYTLTASTSGSGSVSPSGGTYDENTTVTLTATPASGWEFAGWSGDASGTSRTIQVFMDANKSVTAHFTETGGTTRFTLSVATSGNGSVYPQGGTYDAGTTVTLYATPASGWEFAGWSGNANGSNTSVQVTMNANKSVRATFTEISQGSTEIDFQAESAGLTNAVVESEHNGYSGSGYVNFVNQTGSAMSFIVNALSSGNADLTFKFANGSSASRPMDIDVNGATQVYDKSFGSTGGWTSWNETTATVYLDRGENEVDVVSTGSEGGPNMDMITAKGDIDEITAGEGGGGGGTSSDGLVGFAAMGSGTTGGAGGTTVTVNNAGSFLNYAQASGPYIIQVSGTISLSGMNKVASNKTIIGLGAGAVITGGGLNLDDVSNIIIRNIKFTNANDDSINMQDGTHHVWVDHCDFTNGYDGLVDIKRQSSYITVSWNHFYNHQKTCLLGHSDDSTSDKGYLKVTYHHNYFDGTGSRHPRVRFGHVHVFNNYYVGNDYGIASTMNAEVMVEGNYFRNVSSPTHVGYADSGVGDLVERYNVYSNSGSPETRNSVPEFDYSYSLDSASNIPSIVSSGAGVGKL